MKTMTSYFLKALGACGSMLLAKNIKMDDESKHPLASSS
jgi:hypothetical protein